MVSNLNEKQFTNIINLVKSPNIRKILRDLDRDVPKKYRDLVVLLDKKSSGATAYYVRKMVATGLIIKQNNLYYLGRVGKEVAKFAKKLESTCKSFDLDDCDADGKIMVSVQR